MTTATRPLSVWEAAQLLGIHRNTLKSIPPEALPFWRFGKRGDRRYEPEHVMAYKARRAS